MTPLQLSSTEHTILVFLLIAIGLCSRLLPHPPGATALTAIVFASSMFLGTRLAMVVTALLLMLSDAFIGTYELPVMLSVYGSFLLIALIGRVFARTSSTLGTRVLTVLIPSVLFFIITNAALWFFTPWYAKDMGGLLTSYTLGLPFLRNMLVGDLFYTPALLAAVALYMRTRNGFSLPTYEHA